MPHVLITYLRKPLLSHLPITVFSANSAKNVQFLFKQVWVTLTFSLTLKESSILALFWWTANHTKPAGRTPGTLFWDNMWPLNKIPSYEFEETRNNKIKLRQPKEVPLNWFSRSRVLSDLCRPHSLACLPFGLFIIYYHLQVVRENNNSPNTMV